jgi:hypothetical protein
LNFPFSKTPLIAQKRTFFTGQNKEIGIFGENSRLHFYFYEMENLLFTIFFCGILSTFIVILMHKWNITDYLSDLKARYHLFNRLPVSCDFCLSFWASVVIVVMMVVTSLIDFQIMTILVPFGSTAIAQKLLR